MSNSSQANIRELTPAWLACVLVPLPTFLFWHYDYGQTIGLWLLFVCCVNLVAFAFRPTWVSAHPATSWRNRIIIVAIALLSALSIFSIYCLTLGDPHDFVPPFIALQIVIPSLCIVPYLTLITRKPFAAVVLALFLVGSMKMLAGVIVCLAYGWHEYHHDLPWTHPNLMLCAFWANTTVLSAVFYFLGSKKFQRASHLFPD